MCADAKEYAYGIRDMKALLLKIEIGNKMMMPSENFTDEDGPRKIYSLWLNSYTRIFDSTIEYA